MKSTRSLSPRAAPFERWIPAAVVTLLIGTAGGLSGCEPSRDSSEARPNIVLIVSDDQDAPSLRDMPRVVEHLSDRGIEFEHAYATTPVCCPSRSSILLGEYAHNHRVLTAAKVKGGFRALYHGGREASTLATWLQSAGYDTFFAGKYVNGYTRDAPEVPATYVPPGWTRWFGALAPQGYQDYRLNENGTVVSYGRAPEEYLTDVLAAKAVEFIAAASRDEAPFFLYVAPFAPHGAGEGRTPVPAARHAAAFADRRVPRSQSFDEADVSDKPAGLRRRKPLSERAIDDLDEHHRLRLRSLLAVDELVDRIVAALAASGALERTFVFYTSDHGFHLGQHRAKAGKGLPYEEDIRVPLVVRGPGLRPGSREELVLLADLAATIAELAGAEAPDSMDARSLVPLFEGAAGRWRQVFLIEFWAASRGGALRWRGVRTPTHKYVEWIPTGEVEFYDLVADPHELRSLRAGVDDVTRSLLAQRLQALSGCRGSTCRSLEEAPLVAAESLASPSAP